MSFFIKCFACCGSANDTKEDDIQKIKSLEIAKVDTFSNIEPAAEGKSRVETQPETNVRKDNISSDQVTKDDIIGHENINIRLEETNSHSLDMTKSPEFTQKKAKKASSFLNEGDSKEENKSKVVDQSLTKSDISSKSKIKTNPNIKSSNDVSGTGDNSAMIAGIKMNRIQRLEDELRPQEQYDFGTSIPAPSRQELNDTPVIMA